ncbi:hypothetical protein GCM10023156_61260 [Novipirellula rosea]|uniref:Uncharacterized protein n=1 Tax=Novipirellula rosea TaxID=1031540 RepID=A0ABP8NMI3_9BACT
MGKRCGLRASGFVSAGTSLAASANRLICTLLGNGSEIAIRSFEASAGLEVVAGLEAGAGFEAVAGLATDVGLEAVDGADLGLTLP